MTRRVSILGVPVDAVTLLQAVEQLRGMASSSQSHHVLTPNPEMLVRSAKDPVFRSVLQKSSLNVPDGAGLLVAARMLGHFLPARVTGVDLVESLAAEPDVQPIFFLGAAPGVAEKAASMLASRNPALKIAGTFSGSPSPSEESSIVDRINNSGARTLFVAYGAPMQDLWIDRTLPKLPLVRIAMGVGGAFDFLAGIRKRAPKWMQQCGMEWLWRLVQEPSRIGRICNAVIVFPLLVITSRFRRIRRADARTEEASTSSVPH